MRKDVSPAVGWETGRPSVPQFMDMNMASVRGNSKPTVVLFQYDLSDPMNPLGLLIAYAEKEVKPVCSDFDTFVVGTRGLRYEPTPEDQVEVIKWTLDRTQEILEAGNTKGWTGHWLAMMKRESENPDGFKFSCAPPPRDPSTLHASTSTTSLHPLHTLSPTRTLMTTTLCAGTPSMASATRSRIR